jgi:hypothetical protein
MTSGLRSNLFFNSTPVPTPAQNKTDDENLPTGE